MDLTKLTIKNALELLKSKEISAEELTEAHIQKADNDKTNSFITKTFEVARNQAKQASDNILKNNMGKLEGIPVGVKDLFCTKGVKTTAASKMLSNFIPPYESTVTANLFTQGAVMLGKLNMDEFAMGSANSFSYYGQVINPWKSINDNHDLVPGGSSGGSAATVASRAVMGSLGSDTGGSIRQPAAFCGIVGIKPTYGRCSRYGMVAFASSLDQAGVFARTVEDAGIMLESIVGYDSKDSTSSKLALPNLSRASIGHKKLKIGIPQEYNINSIPEEIKTWWLRVASWFESEGHEIRDINLPHTEYGLSVYYVLAPAEASSNLARYDGVRYGYRSEIIPGKTTLDEMYKTTRSEGFGEEVKRRIMIGTSVLSAGQYDAFYKRAQAVRQIIIQDFNNAFDEVDLILTPTTPTEAFRVGHKEADPTIAYLNDIFTVSANLAGLPGISIPVGLSKNGLPLGIQLMARRFEEVTMMRGAYFVEDNAGFNFAPKGI
jgi:aspartyl-tRNA(Asn)/glutamyl-tRNA(Gln) amidotransferase subunit A